MNENTYKFCLRLTPQERAKLEADAKRCGLTKSALLRRMISGLEVKARPSQELRELRAEIHRIGVNINQIARSVNAGIDVYKRQHQGRLHLGIITFKKDMGLDSKGIHKSIRTAPRHHGSNCRSSAPLPAVKQKCDLPRPKGAPCARSRSAR